MKKKFKLQDLDCANCAAKMEDAIKKSEPIPEWHQFFANEKNATKNNAGKN